jgi:hypothetical protein
MTISKEIIWGKKSLSCGENVIYTYFEKQSGGNINKECIVVNDEQSVHATTT